MSVERMREKELCGCWRRGFGDLRAVAEEGCCLRKIGCILAWQCLAAFDCTMVSGRYRGLWQILCGVGAGRPAVHRPLKGEVFPIRLGGLAGLIKAMRSVPMSGALSDSFVSRWSDEAWLFNSIQMENFLHGCRAMVFNRWRKTDLAAVETLKRAVNKTLAQDVHVERSVESVKNELACRFVSYSGEEIPKMEVLSLEQVLPALPPEGHGGCIPVTSWLSGRSKTFLNFPDDCIREDSGQQLPKLQARVHICEEDRIPLSLALCERGVCTWVSEEEVFVFRGEKVLNGMFGVPKAATLDDGRPVLRCIMNLIPSNSTMIQLEGCVRELPGITQYLSLSLGEDETVEMFQSDMVAAFYLFRLPESWHRYLCFNICLDGSKIGKTPGKSFYLACAVLPMGWTSAVSVMQEVSQELLLRGGLESERQIRRTRPIPPWLLQVFEEGKKKGMFWWHVYLDNFFAGERLKLFESGKDGSRLHGEAERSWQQAGVVSSAKKKASNLRVADELGARLDGENGMIGVNGERLVKLLQTTSVVISELNVQRKWLQVICGRWVHVLQFRRMGMAILHKVWKWISGKKLGPSGVCRAREELLMCMFGCCLFNTNLHAKISEVATASDASGRGGAVGKAVALSPQGSDFMRTMKAKDDHPPSISSHCLVVSLFNGIGGAFRCYDVLDVEAEGLIAYEIAAAPNRVSMRRWPQACFEGDVRKISESTVRHWYFKYPHATCLHLWAGFPCVDLSSVKYKRKNLRGDQSGLFFEILRVLGLLRKVFGVHFEIVFFIENVASMDREAAEEISAALGVIPHKVQSADVTPVSRPRYCWTNISISGLPGVKCVKKGYFIEVTVEAPILETSQWLREDSWWPFEGTGTIFPTCMKAIVRNAPPPAPAGITRCDGDTCERWQSDDYRYPPYQYKEPYIIWSDRGWRLIDSSERELLHGYGFDHTAPCLSASNIKRSFSEYEDIRCSLIGDCFSIFSFVIFPWAALKNILPSLNYEHLWARMGMAPGFVAPLSLHCPVQRCLAYGSLQTRGPTVSDLTRFLLSKVNHTGSDVRITTGQILCPKAYPRQSASAQWWESQQCFHCRWKNSEHINSLEMRAILLSLKWRVCHLQEIDVRFAHLTDSYVCMSVISKGRSSSEMLTHIMRKISVFCFTFGLLPILLHVESTENPTDEASRF